MFEEVERGRQPVAANACLGRPDSVTLQGGVAHSISRGGVGTEDLTGSGVPQLLRGRAGSPGSRFWFFRGMRGWGGRGKREDMGCGAENFYSRKQTDFKELRLLL